MREVILPYPIGTSTNQSEGGHVSCSYSMYITFPRMVSDDPTENNEACRVGRPLRLDVLNRRAGQS
jgi:hypothetical protein